MARASRASRRVSTAGVGAAAALARLALRLLIAATLLLDPASAAAAAFFTAAAVGAGARTGAEAGAYGACTGTTSRGDTTSSQLPVAECNAWQDLRNATGASGWGKGATNPRCVGAQYQLDPCSCCLLYTSPSPRDS